MTRPRRAAALRAPKVRDLSTSPPSTPSHSPPSSTPSPPLPLRRMPRPTFRRGPQPPPRTLVHRRTHFDRTVSQHLAASCALSHQANATSQVPHSPPHKKKVVPDHQLFSADFATRVLEADQEEATPLLMTLVDRLRRLGQKGISLDFGKDGSVEKSDGKEEGFKALADVLSADKFVSHASSAVRLLVACLLAELLRISAPDPLLSPRKLEHVCSLFIDQLAVLVVKNDGMGDYRFKLLERLAEVKTFVLFSNDENVICDLFACLYSIVRPHQQSMTRQYFADIMTSMLRETDPLSRNVLDALLAPLVPSLHYSASAVTLAENVLTHSAGRIQVPLCNSLNASIRHFLEQKQGSTPQKRRRGGAKGKEVELKVSQGAQLSEHHGQIAHLLVSINRVAPDILIYVLPGLEDHIRAPDDAVRLANVQLLAQLFTSRQDMAESYPSLFAEFLNRHQDVSPAVRMKVCSSFVGLMASQPKYRNRMEQFLQGRLLDPVEVVRMVVIRSIAELVDFATDDLLNALATRLRDKKHSVRLEALKHLTAMYTARDGTQTPSIKNSSISDADPYDEVDGDEVHPASGATSDLEHEDTNMSSVLTPAKCSMATRLRKFSWLPQTLVTMHESLRGYGHMETARKVEEVMFEKILGARSNESDDADLRIRRFAIFLAGLDDAAFTHMTHVAQERRKCRDSLLKIANYRLKSKKRPSPANITSTPARKTFAGRKGNRNFNAVSNSPPIDTRELQKLANRLAQHLQGTPINQMTKTLCMSLSNAVDLKFYEKIGNAMDCKLSYSERIAACQDAVSRMGSKKPAGVFLQNEVYPKTLPGVFTASHLAAACELAVAQSTFPKIHDVPDEGSAVVAGNGPVELCGVLRYLDLVGKNFPTLLGHALPKLKELVSLPLNRSDSSSAVILMGLKLISRLPPDFEILEDMCELDEIIRMFTLESSLFAVEQSKNLAKWSTRASIRLHLKEKDSQAGFQKEIVAGISSVLDSFDGNAEKLICPMTTLTQLAKHSPQDFKSVALESFDFSRALLCGSFNEKLGTYARRAEDKENRSRRRSETLSRRSSSPSVLGKDAYLLLDMVSDFRGACLAELVHRAVKLLVYALSYVDSKGEELNDVFETLFHIFLEKNGNIFDISPSSESDSDHSDKRPNVPKSVISLYARSRLSAGRGLLYLARHKKFFHRFTPPILLSSVLLAQDEQPNVRIGFAKTIYDQMLMKGLPFRWIVALPLMAVDPISQNVSDVRSMLTTLFRHRRKVFEQAKLENTLSSIYLLPEAVVPELIWVLANLPDVELDQEADFAESEKCLQLMLDRMLESNEFAGVLNEYIEGLSIAQDATEKEYDGAGEKTQRLHALGRITGAILKKKQAGKKWNLSQHPGKISLPKDMFRLINRNAEKSGVTPRSLVDVARMYDNEKNHVSARRRPADLMSRLKAATPARPNSSLSLGNDKGKDIFESSSALQNQSSDSSGSVSDGKDSPKSVGREGQDQSVDKEGDANNDVAAMEGKTPTGLLKRGRKRGSCELEQGSEDGSRKGKRHSPEKKNEKRENSADEMAKESESKSMCGADMENEASQNSGKETGQRTRPVSRQLRARKNGKAIVKAKTSKKAEADKEVGDKPVVRRSSRRRRA